MSRSTRPNASKVGFSISHVVRVVSEFGLSAVSSAQSIGTSQSSAKAISTPTQIRLNSLVRASTLPGVHRLGTVPAPRLR